MESGAVMKRHYGWVGASGTASYWVASFGIAIGYRVRREGAISIRERGEEESIAGGILAVCGLEGLGWEGSSMGSGKGPG